ncbi:class I SAM-dependent methyltransferase [Streptomyces sclerotialus]|uniref:class I SAM-dependent methyltransferase n=1 Tax=Streptomyces sclerotialus TaxID=1957 RepID=UPI0004C55BCD
MGLGTATAERWVERWERQQQRYAIDREERFTVVADVVEHVLAGRPRPVVADLGCGPGSLAARLAGRLPYADVVAVDSDPLLLELGRTHHAHAARFVRAALGEPGWTGALALPGPLDAAVSTTALHCLSEDALRRTYEDLAALLRPGGVLVNSDMLHPDGSTTARIARHVGRRRAERLGTTAHEEWDSWWTAAARDPELAGLFAARRREHRPPRNRHNGLTLPRHRTLLREAGFQETGTVWQCSTDYVLVAVR